MTLEAILTYLHFRELAGRMIDIYAEEIDYNSEHAAA